MAAYLDSFQDEIVERYEGGESIYQLAKAFDVSHMTVYRALRRSNVVMRNRGRAVTPGAWTAEDQLFWDEVKDSKATATELAAQMCMSLRTFMGRYERILAKREHFNMD